MIIEEQNEIFRKIATSIIKSEIDEKWENAILKLGVIENSVDFNLNFSYQDEKKNTKLEGAFFCSREVIKLHKLTNEHPDYKNWNRAIFTLYPDNKFDMEYIWDQDLQDRVDGYNSELS